MLSEREQIDKCLNCTKPKCDNCLSKMLVSKPKVYRKEGVKVIQYTTEWERVCIYPSFKDASTRVGVSASSIRKAAHGYRRTSAGYIWREIRDGK